MNIRYLCDNCRKEYDVWAGIKTCDCADHGILKERICPTCWEWRDQSDYEGDPYACCHDCRVQAKTMIRLGIIAPGETILDIFHERVRMRNCIVGEGVMVSNIELKKGKVIGEIVSDFPAPVIWQEDMKQWQVVDDFIMEEMR